MLPNNGIIERMWDDYRMWQLVRYLSKEGIKYETEAKPINEAFNFSEPIAHSLLLTSFLNNRQEQTGMKFLYTIFLVVINFLPLVNF